MISNHEIDTETKQQTTKHNDNLELLLRQIDQIFDIPSIIKEPQENPQIINYFKRTRVQYRIIHSWEGYLHFGISYDGKHKRENLKEQARIVEGYIRDNDAKNVLELAYGMGTNTAFLARRNPDITFDGIDLSLKPLKRYTKIPNAHFQLGDFHDLSTIENDAYDIVFVVEALCYSTNKLQVLREVKRKLRRDGLFIIMDAYRKDRATPLTPSEDTMVKLIEKGFALNKFECIKDVEGYMREEYSIAAAKDFTQCVLPSIINNERNSRGYFAHPIFARIVNKIVPYEIVKNYMVVYLIPTSIRRQIACYYIHVLKNDKR
jgi:SAM-dependent methyltransferase